MVQLLCQLYIETNNANLMTLSGNKVKIDYQMILI